MDENNEITNDFQAVHDKYGTTHDIKKVYGVEIDLRNLNPNECVCWGDGATYHWLLTEKTK